jgi:glycosyltransferase involved in cell wall biosynthesis
VIFTGYLSDEEIKALMNHCKVFVQPSLCEGFGIPPMEAMSVGANCIVSNRASLPEVYLNSVWYIDPEDYDNINIDKIMQSSKNDNDVILNLYSWKKSALELFNYLKAL